MAIKGYVEAEKEYIIDLRRYFHQHPELSLQEYHTAEKIEAELDGFGVEHQRVGATGVLAVVRHFSDAFTAKTVALRADIDALPIQERNDGIPYKSVKEGVMHACGHDAHAAALLGAVKILKAQEDSLNGTVLFLFQPAEEVGKGAKEFMEQEMVQKADRVMGIHIASYLKSGQIGINITESNASCDYFKITVSGKSAHVSKPHAGIDALYIASQIVVALQSIVARGLDPLESGVVGVGRLEAGTNYNIIAKDAVLEGTTRAFNHETRRTLNRRVEEIARQTASMYGGAAEVEFVDFASPLINDAEVAEEIKKAAEEIVSAENVKLDVCKSMMADNFAEYLLEKKGQYVFVGSRKDEATAYPHHHEKFNIDEDALLVMTNLYVDYAKSLLYVSPSTIL
ncbi:MAG: amidohydrolase [Hespellia sp.]|nr:amidohydrolase [Hespellia sp.]